MHFISLIIFVLMLTIYSTALQLHVPPGGVKCIRESLPAGSTATFIAHATVPLHLHARDWGRRIIARDTGVNPKLNITVPRYGVRRRRPVQLEYTFCIRARNDARVHFDIHIRGEAVFVLSRLVHAMDKRREIESRIFSAADYTAILLVRASVFSGVVLVLTTMLQFAVLQHEARNRQKRQ